MTTAADRFTASVTTDWDHRDCWAKTAECGLSEPDEAALRAFCAESNEDYDTAEAEVMEFVRATKQFAGN